MDSQSTNETITSLTYRGRGQTSLLVYPLPLSLIMELFHILFNSIDNTSNNYYIKHYNSEDVIIKP